MNLRVNRQIDELWTPHIDWIGRTCTKSLTFYLQFTNEGGVIRPLPDSSAAKECKVLMQESRIIDRYQTLKYQKMVEVVMRVVNDNKRKGHSRAAQTLENALKKCRTPKEIMEMCYNMTTRASYMDTYLANSGAITLGQVMKELESIYQDS